MKKPSELSLEQLIKTKKKYKTALIGLSIAVLLALFTYVYLYFFQSKNITFIPLIVLPITFVPIFVSLKSVTDEIKLRKHNEQ
jgi:hypothetical protein